MGTALGIIFVVHRVRTSSKVHLVDLRVSNDPGDSLGTPFLSSTEQENGVLLYSGESQHLAVELFRGRLRVSYDVGNYPVSTMFSYELVADGNYHTVEILAIKKNFTLRVDGGLARSIVNEGPNEFLNVRSPLHIAGVPAQTGTKAWKQWHLRNTTSFIGK